MFDAGRNSRRRCQRESCPTFLNRYNPGPECLLHTGCTDTLKALRQRAIVKRDMPELASVA